MNTIKLFPTVGAFAENKDTARDMRINEIVPILDKGESLVLDFENIDSITQSFAHALISDLIRKYGIDVLDRISFANCNKTVSKILEIVVDYMQ
ncbi:MAG: STAS-like domain-containing protein [Candidatus Paceibacterota bacterium]|jgi:hypothetical protein